MLCVMLAAATAQAQPTVIILSGAPGDEQYAGILGESVKHWEKAAAAGHAKAITIGADTAQTNSRELLQSALQKEAAGEGELWLVMLGHGTFDGRDARFNVRGDDFTAADLAEWLKPIQRPTIVIATFASSGAFLKPLSAPGRIVLTATRSGSEENYSHLGQYLSDAIADPTADLDQDGQTSLLEAWLAATQRVAAFYKTGGRLATEHSLLDDNGDALGTPADWFKGLRAVKKTPGTGIPDGLRANQVHLVPSPAEAALPPAVRAARDQLELELATLREKKATMAEDAYYKELEALLLRLAKVYEGAGS
jgi:hypothetical protein